MACPLVANNPLNPPPHTHPYSSLKTKNARAREMNKYSHKHSSKMNKYPKNVCVDTTARATHGQQPRPREPGEHSTAKRGRETGPEARPHERHTGSSRDLGRLERIPQRSEDARQAPRRGYTSDTRKKIKKKCQKFLHVTFFC